MSSNAIVNTSAGSLFPHNPANRYYEEDKPANRAYFHNIESWICRIGAAVSVTSISSRLMNQYGILQVPTNYINSLSNPILMASAAFVIAGLYVTRVKLHSLNHNQHLDNSNSLSPNQINGFLKRIDAIKAVKNWNLIDENGTLDRLINFLNRFKNIGNIVIPLDADTKISLNTSARVLLSPENRDRFKRQIAAFEKVEANVLSHSKTKGEITDLLHVVERSEDKPPLLESHLKGTLNKAFADSYAARVYVDEQTKDLIVEFEDNLESKPAFKVTRTLKADENTAPKNNNNNNNNNNIE